MKTNLEVQNMYKKEQDYEISKSESVLGIENFDKAWEIASKIANSEMVPDSLRSKSSNQNKTTANVFLVLHSGMKLGFDALQALQSIAIIQGRPVLWGDGLLSLVQNHPSYIRHEETHNETSATCTVYRKGHEPHSVTFTLDDAKKAGLLSKNGVWEKYPKRMLQMRARAFAIRDKFSDALKGLSVAEEVSDSIPLKERKYINKNPVNSLISIINESNGEITDSEPEEIKKESHLTENETIKKENTIQNNNFCSNIVSLVRLSKEGKIDKNLENKWCEAAKVNYLNQLTEEQAKKCIEYLNNNI